MASKIGRPLEILIVEDNPGDVRLTMEALKGNGVRHRLSIVEDGMEAMAFLRRRGKYTAAPRPDLILLDLNLPRKDGRAVLAEMKADKRLRPIPIVVLTTSEADGDIRRAYDLYANCYVAKPGNLDEFIEVVKALEHFWLTIVKLPKEE